MTPAPETTHSTLDAGRAAVHLVTIEAAADGPTVAVLGGVHGDELEGVTAARMVVRRAAAALRAGRLLVVPVSNPLAFATRTRTSSSDGANLARCFPGDAGGRDTDRIADVLTRHVIARSDLVIDLHSAGAAYAMPVFAGCVGGDDEVSQRSVAAAAAFRAPLGWQHAVMNPGRSLSVARDLGVAGVYVEGGGGGGLVGAELAIYVEGVLDVLGEYGNVPQGPARPATTRWVVGGDGDVDASVSTTAGGWCITNVAAGDDVDAGDLIAEIVDSDADVIERIVAPGPATVMMLRRLAEVGPGDGIVMLGPRAEQR